VSATFGEIARVFKGSGTLMLALTGHGRFPQGRPIPEEVDPPAQQPQMTDGTLHKLALGTYLRPAEEQGPTIAGTPNFGGTNMYCRLSQHIW